MKVVLEYSPPRRQKHITPQQARVAQLIADDRNLSYKQIGALLSPAITERTVKAHVRAMSAAMFDGDVKDAYPPRIQVLVWVKQLQWNCGHLPRLEELVDASRELIESLVAES